MILNDQEEYLCKNEIHLKTADADETTEGNQREKCKKVKTDAGGNKRGGGTRGDAFNTRC